jgi:hypothetical protein
VAVTASLLPAAEVLAPSLVVEVQGPSPTTEVAETSSARVALTAEEVMKLATCRYIDFPGIGVNDPEVPQLPKKVYEVEAERMFNETTIMETIASVSKALQEYERAGGFTPAVASDATETALAAPEAHVELTTDVPVLAPVNEGREASPPQLVETAEAPAPVAEADAAEAVVVAEGSSPPRTVAVEAEGVEARVPGELVTVVQESATPGTMTRVASPEILEAEETGASLSQGATSCEARTLELACASWAVTSGLDANSEDDEEVAACHTLECGMTWARDAFDELILPATSVSFLVKDYLLDSAVFLGYASYLVLVSCRPSSLQAETCPRGAQTPREADSARDAARRGMGGDGWCHGERDFRASIP